MLNHISIDVTDAKECAVPQDKFRINNYTFTPGAITEDLVHNSAPYIHLQILRPKDDEQRDKAIVYFKEHQKQYITFADRKEILLYLGTTQEAYIKSSVALTCSPSFGLKVWSLSRVVSNSGDSANMSFSFMSIDWSTIQF